MTFRIIQPTNNYTDEKPTYEDMLSEILELPNVENLGVTSDPNKNVYGVPIGDMSKPTIFISSGIHGNEWPSVPYAIEFVRLLTGQKEYPYPMISDLLNRFSFYVIPMLNPNFGDSRFNAYGVDLNRNFDNGWLETESSEKGTAPFSEPESIIVRDKVLELKPIAFADCHCQAGVDLGDGFRYGDIDVPDYDILYTNKVRKSFRLSMEDREGTEWSTGNSTSKMPYAGAWAANLDSELGVKTLSIIPEINMRESWQSINEAVVSGTVMLLIYSLVVADWYETRILS